MNLTELRAAIGHAERGSLTDLGKVLRSIVDGDVQLQDGDFQTLTLDGTQVTATADELNRIADVSGRVVVSTDAGTLALTAALHGDRIVYFNDADGDVTLPAATGSGIRFKVVIGTAATAMTITVTPDTDEEFAGGLNGVDDDSDAAYAWKAEDNDDTISLDGTATGGKVGDWFEFVDIASGVWLVSGFITQSGGSEATPFSADISAP